MSDEKVPAKSGKILTFSDVKNVNDTSYDVIPVPEWGGDIHVGTLSAQDLLEFVESQEDPAKQKTAGVRLLVKSMIDGNKERLAKNEEQLEEGIKIFLKKDAKVISRVAKHLLKFNEMDKEGRERAKNESGEAPSDASPTN